MFIKTFMKFSTMPTNLSMMAARAAFIIMAAVTIGVSASTSSPYEPTRKFNNNGLSASVIRASSTTTYEQPPYSGTIFVEPNIVKSTDPTLYKDYTYKGMGMRNIFDRREGSFVYVSVHLFKANYSHEQGKTTVEVFVHNEFTFHDAAKEVEKYAPVVGQMPWTFIAGLGQVWIMKGDESWGGGTYFSPHVLIHTGSYAIQYDQQGIMEETLIHEAVHAVLDDRIYKDPAWYDAVKKDGRFISTYARDYPRREDAAETILLCFALSRPERLTSADLRTIVRTVPNRCQYYYARIQGYAFSFSELLNESIIGASLVDSTATSGMFSMNSGGGGGGGLFVGVVAIVAVVVGAVGLLLARKKGEHDGYEEILLKHKQTNNSLI